MNFFSGTPRSGHISFVVATLLALVGALLILSCGSGSSSSSASQPTPGSSGVVAGASPVPSGSAAAPTADSVAGGSATTYGFRTVADVPLPGGRSRFDYESLDPQSHRLYIAHLGASLVTVFDTQTGKVVGNVNGIKEVHGVLAVPETGKVYAAATGDNQVAVIDPQSLSVVATVPAGEYPDGLAFDPDNGKLYVSDESGGTDTVIDTRTNQRVATIQLGGEAGNTQYDPASHLIFVAVQGKGQIVGIDPNTDQVGSRDDVSGCDYPHGLYINPARRTAFIGCERNNKLAVVDMQSMKVTSTVSVGQTPDVLAFDPSMGRLYVASEGGDFTAFVQDDAGVRQIARASVGNNAHSVAVNPDTHHLYVPLEDSGGQPVLREIALEPQ